MPYNAPNKKIRYNLYVADLTEYKLLPDHRPQALRINPIENSVILYPDPNNQSCYKACFFQDGKPLLNEDGSLKEVEMGDLTIEGQGLLNSKTTPDYYALLNQAFLNAELEVPRYIINMLLAEDMLRHPEVCKTLQDENNLTEHPDKGKRLKLSTSETKQTPADFELIYKDLMEQGIVINVAIYKFAKQGYTELVNYLLEKEPGALKDAVYGAAKGGKLDLLEDLMLIAEGRYEDYSNQDDDDYYNWTYNRLEKIANQALNGLLAHAKKYDIIDGEIINKIDKIITQYRKHRPSVDFYNIDRGRDYVYLELLEDAALKGNMKNVKYCLKELNTHDYSILTNTIKLLAQGNHQDELNEFITYCMSIKGYQAYKRLFKEAIKGGLKGIFVYQSIQHIKLIEDLMKRFPDESDLRYFDKMFFQIRKMGHLKDEHSISLVLSQFEHEDFRKRFVQLAKKHCLKTLNANQVLLKAKQLYLFNQINVNNDQTVMEALPNIYDLLLFVSQTSHTNYLNTNIWIIIATYLSPFNMTNAHDVFSAAKQRIILGEVEKYTHSLSRFWCFQRKRANTFFEECKNTSEQDRLTGLMNTIDKVTPNQNKQLYSIVEKYQSKKRKSPDDQDKEQSSSGVNYQSRKQ